MSHYKKVKPLVPHIEDNDVVVLRVPMGTPQHKKDKALDKMRTIAKQLQKNQTFWDFL